VTAKRATRRGNAIQGRVEQGSQPTLALARFRLQLRGSDAANATPSFFAFALRVSFLAAFGAGLAGCHDFGDVTESIGASTTPPKRETKLRTYADDCGKRYERNPGG
jgi:hypothetical protein